MSEKNTETAPASEELLQGTIDVLTGYIAILDRRGTIVMTNQAWNNLAAHNSIEGKNYIPGANYIETCKNFNADPIGNQLAEGIKDVIDGRKKSFEFEYPYLDENHWYITRITPFGVDENRHVIVSHENITSRKLIEIALRESEESYRILAQTASDVIIKIDATSTILFINRAGERVFGYKASEMIGKSLTMIMPEHLRDAHRKGIACYLQTRKRKLTWQSLELPALHKDGHIFPLEISFGESERQGSHFFIAVARDITGRKETEKATAHLAAIVKSSDDAIVSKNLDGIITSWNKGAEKVFGYTAEEVIGKPITILIPPHLLDEEKEIIRRIRKGVQVNHYNTVRRRKDGSHINVFLTVSPIQDEAGTIIGASKIARDITERVRTEEVLRENQMMLALAMQSSRMGAWERDVATDIVIWSEELEEIFGLEKGSFDQTLEAYNNLVYEEDREKNRLEITRAIKEHRAYSTEFRFYHADGSIRWMEGRGQAVYSDKGEPVRLYGIGIDITERKESEIALQRNEANLRDFLENASVGIHWVDAKGIIVWANRAELEMLGYSREEYFGHHISEFHVDDNTIDDILKRLSGGETLNNYEAGLRHKDGSIRYGLINSNVLWEDDNFVHTRCFTRDITERKQAEEKLFMAERRAVEEYQALLSRIVPLAQTLGTSRDLITIYRTVGEFIRASMSCSAFFISFYDAEKNLRIAAYVCGEDGEVDISSLPPMLLAKDGGPNSQAIFEKKSVIVNRYMDLMKNRPHVIIQEDGIDPNSSLVVPMKVMNRIIGTFEVQAYENDAFTDEHVVALEMVANLAAVAIENVRLLEVEAKARQEAEAANRAKDEFLSVLSHELRTPLNAMLGWTRMMKSGILDEARTGQAIDTIERNARLQNNLIEDLLDVSRIISGKMRIESEDVDIVSVVKTCVETAQPSAEEKNISLTFKSDAPAQKISGDATRLQQIVNNLLNNAVKFTPADGVISVNLEQADGAVQLKVSDTGIGISPEFLPMIFDRFKQADSTTKRSHSGLGLGLTIVRHLTELHGGRVEVDSRGEGLGSAFTICLPLVSTPDETTSTVVSDYRDKNAFRLKGAKILLVDDDCEGIQPLQIFLETQQADVHCAGSAKDALQKIAEHRFDVLVSDIGMPGMDGYELIGEARKLTDGKYFLPAVAMTAYASTQDRERALSAGYQTHLPKPVDFDQFLSVINNLLNNHE
jgi:PAS domain S-box-containing protein